MVRACHSVDFDPRQAARVLDFGCSNGRVTRWFGAESKQEVWGCDLQVRKVMWAQQNLGPPARYFVNSAHSHLPFEDRYFEFVMAQSIFTHLQELHIAWLLELLRVTKHDGCVYVTITDERSLDISHTEKAQRVRDTVFKGLDTIAPDLSEVGYVAVNPYNAPGNLAQVYMSERYVRSILPPFAEIMGIIPQSYSNFQSGYVIRKC
jgi:ubiquinone/menaquinone biosynthesis C-methylase UbiE